MSDDNRARALPGTDSGGDQDLRHADEVYTIKQVERLTGVSQNTIRSWERRHGIPSPGRSRGNQRRYSVADVAAIVAMRDARANDLSIDQAIREAYRQPAPIVHAPAIPAAPPTPTATQPGPAKRLLVALGDLDEGAASQVLVTATWSGSIAQACMEVLIPAAAEVDRFDATGTFPPATTMLARAWIERKLLAALDQLGSNNDGEIVIAAALYDLSGRLDALGQAIALASHGYDARWLGEATSAAHLCALAIEAQPAAVVLAGQSALSRAAIDAVAERLRGEGWPGVIAVAGGAAGGHRSMVPLPRHAQEAPRALAAAIAARSRGLRLVGHE